MSNHSKGLSIKSIRNELQIRDKDEQTLELVTLVDDLIDLIKKSKIPDNKPSEVLFKELKEWSIKLKQQEISNSDELLLSYINQETSLFSRYNNRQYNQVDYSLKDRYPHLNKCSEQVRQKFIDFESSKNSISTLKDSMWVKFTKYYPSSMPFSSEYFDDEKIKSQYLPLSEFEKDFEQLFLMILVNQAKQYLDKLIQDTQEVFNGRMDLKFLAYIEWTLTNDNREEFYQLFEPFFLETLFKNSHIIERTLVHSYWKTMTVKNQTSVLDDLCPNFTLHTSPDENNLFPSLTKDLVFKMNLILSVRRVNQQGGKLFNTPELWYFNQLKQIYLPNDNKNENKSETSQNKTEISQDKTIKETDIKDNISDQLNNINLNNDNNEAKLKQNSAIVNPFKQLLTPAYASQFEPKDWVLMECNEILINIPEETHLYYTDVKYRETVDDLLKLKWKNLDASQCDVFPLLRVWDKICTECIN